MAFDYKKEYKEFYLPPKKPGIVTIPPMNLDRKSTRLNSSHPNPSRMPSSA